MKAIRLTLAAALVLAAFPFSAGTASADGLRSMQVPSILGGGTLGQVPLPTELQGRAVQTPEATKTTFRYDALISHVTSNYPQIPKAAVQKMKRYLRERGARNSRYATIIDFDQPSYKKRMFVIRLADGHVDSYLVSHAKNSGNVYAKKFSNVPQSKTSSLGLYLTANEYRGKHGRSMRLRGLESTNSNAMSRAIVLHGAKYVNDAAAARGRIGRSWGCPAVDMKYKDRIIDHLKGGSVFIIHHS